MFRRAWSLGQDLGQDVRYGLRQWRLSPIFAATALVVLAAGSGANLALFGLLDALVLRPLPVRHPHELVAFSAFDPKHPADANLTPIDAFEPFRRTQAVFSHVAVYYGGGVTIERDGVFSDVPAAFVDESYFDVLQVGPALGRLLTSDDLKGAARVAVLTDVEWQRHYSRSPDAVGKIVQLHGQPFTIVGVSQPGFAGLRTDAEVAYALPITTMRSLFASEGLGTDFYVGFAYGVGRLRPGVTIDQARAELQSLWPAIRQSVVPSNLKGGERDDFLALELKVESAARGFSDTRDWYSAPLSVLAAATAWLLLVACANLAGLMLSRAILRQGEVAIRTALGASRGRLARQWLTEGLLLSSVGTALGLPIAWWSARVLSRMLFSIWAPDPSFHLDLTPDWRVTAVIVASVLATGVVVGLGASWRASRRTTMSGMRLTTDASTSRWVDGLLIGQVAIALVLLMGAVLFARSLSNLRGVSPGFRTSGTAAADIAFQPGRDPKRDPLAYCLELRDRLMAIPGVQSVAFSDVAPAWGFAAGEEKVAVAPAGAASGEVEATFVSISPDFFRTLEIPLRAGRDFTWKDDADHPRGAIVSSRLAEKLFGRLDPIGREIRFGSAPELQRIAIVGVSSDARLADMHTRDPLFVFLPMMQARTPIGRAPEAIEIRWAGAFGSLQPRIAREVQSLGQDFVYDQFTMSERVEQSFLRERLLAAGGYGFGLMAVAIVVIGLFGLLASSVAARTRELGIRAALGASSPSLQWLVVGRAVRIAAIGVAIGFPLMWITTRELSDLLSGVGAHDAVSVSVAIVLLVASSLASAWWPARRAARVDPIRALRTE
jgi:predicted permease